MPEFTWKYTNEPTLHFEHGNLNLCQFTISVGLIFMICYLCLQIYKKLY